MLDSSRHLFYQPDLHQQSEGILTLSETNAHHALQVLRLKNGNPILLTNGLGSRAEAHLIEATKKACKVMVESNVFNPPQVQRRVAIGISPVKNASRFEWFLEKATELGVADIYPLLCHRTERQHFRTDRLQNICISAMLQSQQCWLPKLHPPMLFEEALTVSSASYSTFFIAHCLAENKEELSSAVKLHTKDALLLIGPEGDFTPTEIALALSKGFTATSLGATRLRTETAGVAGAALLCLI